MPDKSIFFGRTALAIMISLVALPCLAAPGGYGSDTRAYNLAHGRVIFADKCMRCHESGRKGAPVVGDAEDWQERVEQSLNVMIEHAIKGHGEMPARGDQDLSDQEVAAAVAYVVHRSREIVAAELGELPSTAAGPGNLDDRSPSDRATVHMLLLLLNQLRPE